VIAGREPQWWAGLRGQWSSHRRLRWGVLVIGALLWIQGLLVLGDSAKALRQQADSLREDVQRLQVQARSKGWSGRADDARQQVDALRSMLWQEGDIGLAEAAAQDWVRALATKFNLGVRELAVARPGAAPAGAPATALAPQRLAGVQPIKLRVTVDLNRLALMGFLSELAQHERVVVVDRLILRPASRPPTAELDLRLLAAVKVEAK
jgi:Type II secretion system (T2SS), protein M subtype b